MGCVDIVENKLPWLGKAAFDRFALLFGQPGHLAIGGQGCGDGRQSFLFQEGAQRKIQFAPPVRIIHRVDAAATRHPQHVAGTIGERDQHLAAAAIDAEDEVAAHSGAPRSAIVASMPRLISSLRQCAERPASVMTFAALKGATL